jgi:hypothetical protein
MHVIKVHFFPFSRHYFARLSRLRIRSIGAGEPSPERNYDQPVCRGSKQDNQDRHTNLHAHIHTRWRPKYSSDHPPIRSLALCRSKSSLHAKRLSQLLLSTAGRTAVAFLLTSYFIFNEVCWHFGELACRSVRALPCANSSVWLAFRLSSAAGLPRMSRPSLCAPAGAYVAYLRSRQYKKFVSHNAAVQSCRRTLSAIHD